MWSPIVDGITLESKNARLYMPVLAFFAILEYIGGGLISSALLDKYGAGKETPEGSLPQGRYQAVSLTKLVPLIAQRT